MEDNSSGSSSSLDDSLDKIVEDWEDEDAVMLIQLLMIASSTSELFNPNEMESQGFVDHTIGVRDTLGSMLGTPNFFKTLTNFEIEEWNELCTLVVPIIRDNARSTGVGHKVRGRPMKLTPEQRLLNFILYMKHDNTIQLDAYAWNWSQLLVCDDALFVASCICEAIADEIRWPSAAERRVLARTVPQFFGCIGFIDGTLVKIRRPRIPEHSIFFNGRKKMYSLNNTVIVDHNRLFIYVDLGYPGRFHDVNILRNLVFHPNWRQFFTVQPEYFEYLLGDPGYLGEEQYIMRRIGILEVADNQTQSAVNAYNRMHAGHRIAVEWALVG